MGSFRRPRLAIFVNLILPLFGVVLLGFTIASPLYSYIELKSLNYNDASLQKLRDDIALHLKNKGRIKNLIWHRYKVQPQDNFFKIMAKTSQNHDTLSSVNRLASIFDIEKGQTWLIPNARGIALSEEEIRQKYPQLYAQKQYYAIPQNPHLFFVPHKSFSSVERKFFNLEIFIRPIAGRLTSSYGTRNDPFTRKQRFHKGIDIGAAVGTPVVASAAGKVIHSGWINGYGNTVILEHSNGYQTLYAHLSKLNVKKNQTVKQGATIAQSGNTGRSTGPHLHFEVLRKGKAMRPHF